MRWRFLLLIAGAIGSGACEQPARSLMTSPSAYPLRAAKADERFRLSEADRQRIIPGFDPAALERLLARIVPERRSDVLSMFQIPEDPTPGKGRGWVVGFNDPDLQPFVDEVWATMWDHVGASDADIDADVYHYPGREIALQRRAARRSAPITPE